MQSTSEILTDITIRNLQINQISVNPQGVDFKELGY